MIPHTAMVHHGTGYTNEMSLTCSWGSALTYAVCFTTVRPYGLNQIVLANGTVCCGLALSLLRWVKDSSRRDLYARPLSGVRPGLASGSLLV